MFLVHAVDDGYGGLEHRASTALLCARDDLPQRNMRAAIEGYRTFLGLASHEYFHAWNVKRLRPADFDTLDLQAPNPTELLWFFEGFTSYYDDLALVRCGLIDPQRYLDVLVHEMVERSHCVLVPAVPSVIDIRATESFIHALLAIPRVRAGGTRVGIVANNYLIYPYLALLGIQATPLELPDKLWNLMTLGVGGYVAGRTGEKIIETWKGK